jgi:hypothetical protein
LEIACGSTHGIIPALGENKNRKILDALLSMTAAGNFFAS